MYESPDPHLLRKLVLYCSTLLMAGCGRFSIRWRLLFSRIRMHKCVQIPNLGDKCNTLISCKQIPFLTHSDTCQNVTLKPRNIVFLINAGIAVFYPWQCKEKSDYTSTLIQNLWLVWKIMQCWLCSWESPCCICCISTSTLFWKQEMFVKNKDTVLSPQGCPL